tara:strand:+ start:2509 stop:2667 length:159 start_codon:yes stop_codon:yes gene_type:complete
MARKKVSLGGDISKSVKGTFSLDKFKEVYKGDLKHKVMNKRLCIISLRQRNN